MKREVESPYLKNKTEFLEAIIKSWEQIDMVYRRNCIDNISDKMHKIIEREGNLL